MPETTQKFFYDELISLKDIYLELERSGVTVIEKEELLLLIHKNLHQGILLSFLAILTPADHNEFLEKFLADPSDQNLWQMLALKSGREPKAIVKKEIAKIKKELLAEIKHAKKSPRH